MNRRSRHIRLTLLLVSASCIATSLPASALAQSASADVQSDATDGVIIVTAERREQSVQDIPSSIAAFGETQLRDLRVNQASDLTKLTPGLTVRVSGGGSDPQFTIRGIGMNSSDVNQNPAVTTYLNDIAMPSIAMVGLQMFDLERAEVLKGPQGTLYGRNTTGGAVNLITKRPTQNFSIDARADVGSLSLRDIEVGVGGSIAPALAGRIAVNVYQRNGWQTLVLGPRHGNVDTRNGDLDRKAVRGSLLWEPTDGITALLVADYAQTNDEAMAYEHSGNLKNDGSRTFCSYVTTGIRDEGNCASYSRPRTGVGGTIVNGVNIYADKGSDPRTSGASFIYGNDNDAKTGGFSLKIDAELGAVNLTSVTGYRKYRRTVANDDGSPYVLSDALRKQNIAVFQQELRFGSSGSGPLNWVAGVYFTKDAIRDHVLFDQSDQFSYSAAFNSYYRQATEALAMFGQIDWAFADRLKLSVGGRYTGERKSYYYDGTVYGTGSFPVPVRRYNNQINGEKATWRATLQWEPVDDINLYANISTGFKGGGFPGTIGFSAGQLSPFKPETITAYEAGVKASLLDRHLLLNLSAYYYDWTDFQATTQVNVSGVPLVILASAGDAKVTGVEGDISLFPFRGFTLRVGANYNDARIKTGLYANQTPPNTPKLTANLLARYELPRDAGSVRPFVQVDASYNSSTYVALANLPTVLEPKLLLANARVGLKLENGIEIAGWVRNLTDKLYRTSILGSGSASLPARATYADPRTWGISLGYHF